VGKSQRRKGQRGERETAILWRSVYPDARRGSQSRSGKDASDVEGTPWWIECKTLAHRTYNHCRNELMFELVSLCRACHDRIHGIHEETS